MTREEAAKYIKERCIGSEEERDGTKWSDAMWIAIETLSSSEKPTADRPKSEWIPVSERLPEVSDYYLIQHSRHICPDEMAVAFYSVEEAELDKNYTWEFKPFADCKEVIAWMPLPEPYKGE